VLQQDSFTKMAEWVQPTGEWVPPTFQFGQPGSQLLQPVSYPMPVHREWTEADRLREAQQRAEMYATAQAEREQKRAAAYQAAEKKHAALLGTPSLVDLAQDNIVEEIISHVKQIDDGATFAIGGNLSIKDEGHGVSSDGGLSASKVQICFGEHDSQQHKVVLPLSTNSDDTQSSALAKLLAACTPASFGRDGKDIIDESYRKAGKLDTTKFVTDFCPYSTGIVDTITQAFTSNVVNRISKYGVIAKLYKLNVYSAPSGHFKSHVDTPRGGNQFGSLVVSLPIAHQGGELIVKHGDRSLKLDFAEKSTEATIQWAAFYSDCEHEVLTVTSGHRITLTYNLFSTPLFPARLAGLSTPIINAEWMPLYGTLGQALESPSFFPNGRVLAMVLSHSYAHTSEQSCFLPEALKGSDMTLLEICRALKLGTYIRPVTDHMVKFMRGTEGRHYPEKEPEGKVWVPDYDDQDRLINARQIGLKFAPAEIGDYMPDTEHVQEHMQEMLKTRSDWQTNGLVKEECTTWLQQCLAKKNGEQQFGGLSVSVHTQTVKSLCGTLLSTGGLVRQRGIHIVPLFFRRDVHPHPTFPRAR
jgi:hypothetical protein